MRLCDEYHERMNLDFLCLKHSSKFFIFFDNGDKLLSVKWNNSNSGYYEFVECVLGKNVKVFSRTNVDWHDFEKFFSKWIDSHDGFVFDKKKILHLVWIFFVIRNDAFLSERYNPITIFKTLDLNSDSLNLIKKISTEISSSNCRSSLFWKNKSESILLNYAYWIQNRY